MKQLTIIIKKKVIKCIGIITIKYKMITTKKKLLFCNIPIVF